MCSFNVSVAIVTAYTQGWCCMVTVQNNWRLIINGFKKKLFNGDKYIIIYMVAFFGEETYI